MNSIRKFSTVVMILGMSLSFRVVAQPTTISINTDKLLDMTFTFDKKAIYWPTAESFKVEKVDWRILEGGWWHADAPIHFYEKGRTIDQIPLQEWIGPAVKIDVVSSCQNNRDYLLTVATINGWEEKNGRVPVNAWILMYTGIDTKFYPDRKMYWVRIKPARRL